MNKNDLPRLTRYMYAVLELINNDGVVEAPRKVLPDRVKNTLGLPDTILRITKKNGVPLNTDRTGWSLTYLKKAELIDFPNRGCASITPRGKEYLTRFRKDREITVKNLLRLEAFKDFYTYKVPNPSRQKALNHDVRCTEPEKDQNATVQDGMLKIAISRNIFPDFLRDMLGAGYTITKANELLSIIKN